MPDIVAVRAEEGLADYAEEREDERETAEDEPLLPIGLDPVEPATAAEAPPAEESWVEPIPEPQAESGELTSLFDRLADDEGLYANLTPADETFAGPPPEPVAEPLVPEPLAEAAAAEPDPAPVRIEDVGPEADDIAGDAEPGVPPPAEPVHDAIGAIIAGAAEEQATADVRVWRVIGRGFMPLSVEARADGEPPEPEEAAIEAPDAETVERVSRYNFDELSRILTDRVSAPAASPVPAAEEAPAAGGALINLAGETFILNRLPLGILVFRDQQVLFANRALTELTGYESIDSLRAAGLTAIFPSEGAGASGPVTQLVRRDGSLAPVNARLQSITWHGKPALMLSASLAEQRVGHEAAVRAFAELAALMSDDGFFSADRAGVITSVSLHGRIVLGEEEEALVGRPLAALIEPAELGDLKRFLERPARFAETARPSIVMTGVQPGVRLVLFAEGQAGIVTGYFGFLRKLPVARPTAPKSGEEIEPSMLTRISRGVRRPLNTVIGFADLIRSSAFGSIENGRYLEYAQDIKTAGEEIAALVDELDDYARLREGRYAAQPDEIDLASLLDGCIARVRGQAGGARVLIRNAVSERLPRIVADRASLTQAILNLLASAIDQTPAGASVILSAQQEDDGAVVVNLRDGGTARTDLGERFVVFRDGVGKDGEALQPVRSSVGLALTRSLLAVNALSLSVDPTASVGTLFSLLIPADLVKKPAD